MQPKFTQKIIGFFRIKILALALVLISFQGISYSQVLFNEGFDTVVPAAWTTQNNSNPVSGVSWFQGFSAADGAFDANSGAPTSYIGIDYESVLDAGTISNWLISPNIALKDGDIFTFYTRALDGGGAFPDRLQVRLSTNGASTDVGATETSVGDFTTLLLDINPTYSSTVYPEVWTKFTITISGLGSPMSGRIAFRYFVEDAGLFGLNSNYIGIDDAVYTTFTGPCSGTPVAGNTLSSVPAVCPATPFSLSLENPPTETGLTYQWQSSSTLAGPYSDIPGATSSTLSTTQSAATYYQVNVTCTASGNTGASTPVQVLLNAPSACYCVPSVSTCDQNDEILNVSISNLNNSSSGCTGTGYTNYTTGIPTAALASGGSNPISVTVGPGGQFGGFDYVGVWIDYDHNGVFDPSEFTFIGPAPQTGGTVSGNIVIPTSAIPGDTRMRVRVSWDFISTGLTPTDACTDLVFGFGETEDYTVTIAACSQGAFTTQPANTSAACGGDASFNVGTLGSLITYQWEQRVSPTDPWTFITDGGIYSGATTATLTLTGITAADSNYEFRAVINGACTATDFSNSAVLTVTASVALVDPESALICAGGIAQLSLINVISPVNLIDEGFAGSPVGWAFQNNSNPLGAIGWTQGVPAAGGAFDAHSGDPNSYAATDYEAVSGQGTISNWLITPTIPMKNGDVLTFYTRGLTGGEIFPDRMQIRMSTNDASTDVGTTETSVGDFTTLLLDINPNYTTTDFPEVWTKFTVIISGLSAPATGRLAFRYFVEDGGALGSHSDYIGLDDVVYSSGGIASGIWSASPATPNSMFTDALGTVPYDGTAAHSIYVKPTENTDYSVVFSSPGCTSAPAVIPVTLTAPITSLSTPASKDGCINGTVSFSAEAVSAGPVTYQWQELTTDVGADFANIPGETSSTLTIEGLTLDMDGYQYRLIAKAGSCGSDTSAAGTLSVFNLPTVTIAAASPSLLLTPGLTNPVTATSTPAGASYTWTLNGSVISGVTGNIIPVDIDGIGTYNATVTDIHGCVNSSNDLFIGFTSSDRLWIYPNPSTGVFQVRLYGLGSPNEKRRVSVYNAAGGLIVEKIFTLDNTTNPYQKMEFDLNKAAPGIYLVKVANEYSKKIVSGFVIVAR